MVLKNEYYSKRCILLPPTVTPNLLERQDECIVKVGFSASKKGILHTRAYSPARAAVMVETKSLVKELA